MDQCVAIVGLGYVGLPLAVAFGKKGKTFGFDINPKRIKELREGVDSTREVEKQELAAAENLSITDQLEDIRTANTYIITVPTPIDEARKPALGPLIMASRSIGKVLNRGDLVIFESTVFPGCTEEICVPLLEAESGLVFNQDFVCGYSPERINPGDKTHRLETIRKVVSGSNAQAAERVRDLYETIISAGTYLAPNIKTAEGAKVIENAQRDINIAFVNELAIIFEKMGIDTHEVLQAAQTKWNFLPFTPGLVGGHCIGVDPYYLTYKAEMLGYHPQVILSGREINDGMGPYVANRVVKQMIKKGQKIQNAKVLVLGITFKENCPDIRNTKVVDLIKELEEFGVEIDVHDPVADREEVFSEYGIRLADLQGKIFDAIILAVPHCAFQAVDPMTMVQEDGVVFDIKGFFEKSKVHSRL